MTNIYIARGLASGLLKIGRSINVRDRLVTLCSAWEPMELLAVIPGAIQMEREMHRHFAASAAGVRGIEWFRDDGVIVDFIATLPERQRGSTVFVIRRPRGPSRATKATRNAAWVTAPRVPPRCASKAIFARTVAA